MIETQIHVPGNFTCNGIADENTLAQIIALLERTFGDLDIEKNPVNDGLWIYWIRKKSLGQEHEQIP